jgi:hypothetical protein
MNPTLRNTLLALSIAGALSAALVAVSPTLRSVQAPVDVRQHRPAQPRPTRSAAHTVHEETPSQPTEEKADDHESHTADYDPSKPFDPSILNEQHEEPTGLDPDLRDELLVTLDGEATRRDKRRAIATLSRQDTEVTEVTEVFRSLFLKRRALLALGALPENARRTLNEAREVLR